MFLGGGRLFDLRSVSGWLDAGLFPPFTTSVYDLLRLLSGVETCCSITCWVIFVTVTAGVDAGASDVP